MSVTEEPKQKSVVTNEYELRLADVFQWLSDSRRTVFIWAACALAVGALYAFSTPNEFTTEVRIMPELKSSMGGGSLGDLKSLAGMAGVNLDNVAGSTEAIRPDLYPNIISSIPFALYILSQPVYSSELKKTLPLQRYLKDQQGPGFLNWLSFSKSAPTPLVNRSQVLSLSREQETLFKEIYRRIETSIDKKTGIITITTHMRDPVVTGMVAQLTLEYLKGYVTNYRTGKARQQVQFLEQQVRTTRRRYENAEYTLSAWRDRNRSANLVLYTAKIEEQRLQSDYMLAQTVYNEMAKQLEQARIKVQEEAPVFQTLDPPIVPLRKSGPKRLVIMVAFAIFGALVGLTVAFARRFAGQPSSRFV